MTLPSVFVFRRVIGSWRLEARSLAINRRKVAHMRDANEYQLVGKVILVCNVILSSIGAEVECCSTFANLNLLKLDQIRVFLAKGTVGCGASDKSILA